MSALLPVLAFLTVSHLAVFIVLLSLPPSWMPSRPAGIRTVPLLALVLWLFVAVYIRAIDAVLWPSLTSTNVGLAPVWCDISTKLSIGALAGIAGASLGTARMLELMISRRKYDPATYGKHRHWWIDMGCVVVLPVAYMALHFLVQQNRFVLVPTVGCVPSIRMSESALVTMLVPPVLVGALALGFCFTALIHLLIIRSRTSGHALATHLTERMGYTYAPRSFVLRLGCATVFALGSIGVTCLAYLPDLLYVVSQAATSTNEDIANTNTIPLASALIQSRIVVAGDPGTAVPSTLSIDWALADVPVYTDPAEVRRRVLVVWALLGLGLVVLGMSVAGAVGGGEGAVWPWGVVGGVVGRKVERVVGWVKRRVLGVVGERKMQTRRPELSRLTIPTKPPSGSLTSASTSKTSLSLDNSTSTVTPVSPPRPLPPPGLGLYAGDPAPRPKAALRSGWDEMLEMEDASNSKSRAVSGIFKFNTFPRRDRSSRLAQSPADLEMGLAGGVARSPSNGSSVCGGGGSSSSSPEPEPTTPLSPEDAAFAESTRAYLSSPVAHALGLAGAGNTMPSSQSPSPTRRDRSRRNTAIIGVPARHGRGGYSISVMSTPAPSPTPSEAGVTVHVTPPRAGQAPLTAVDPPPAATPPRLSSLPKPPSRSRSVSPPSTTTSPSLRVPPKQPIPKDTGDGDGASTCSSIWDSGLGIEASGPWPVPPAAVSPVRSPLRSASVSASGSVVRSGTGNGNGNWNGIQIPLKPILKPPRPPARST